MYVSPGENTNGFFAEVAAVLAEDLDETRCLVNVKKVKSSKKDDSLAASA